MLKLYEDLRILLPSPNAHEIILARFIAVVNLIICVTAAAITYSWILTTRLK